MDITAVAKIDMSKRLVEIVEDLYECKLPYDHGYDNNPAVALVLALATIHGNVSVDFLQQAVIDLKFFNNEHGNLRAHLGSKFFDRFRALLYEFDGEGFDQLTSVTTTEDPIFITYTRGYYLFQTHHGSPFGEQYAEYFHPQSRIFMKPRTVVQSNPHQCSSDHAFTQRLAVEYRDATTQCDDDAANALKIVEAADAEAARIEAVDAEAAEASDALFAANLGRS